MTTTQIPSFEMSKTARDALVDQLRACHSKEDILNFEELFNSQSKTSSLHEVICMFLRNRSISRGLAAKLLLILLEDKQSKLMH